jgi:toxin HigB-1
MILSFKCKDALALFEGKTVKRFRAYSSIAQRKLAQIHAAQTLDFLRSPPGNQLEALKGDRKGQHIIRINDQWRICVVWTKAGPAHIEVVDCH